MYLPSMHGPLEVVDQAAICAETLHQRGHSIQADQGDSPQA